MQDHVGYSLLGHLPDSVPVLALVRGSEHISAHVSIKNNLGDGTNKQEIVSRSQVLTEQTDRKAESQPGTGTLSKSTLRENRQSS